MQRSSSESERQRLVVGLGNPGDKYRDTRHNLGYRVLDDLAKSVDAPPRRLECNALVASARVAMLAWPQTYMNRSGYAVRCLVEQHGFSNEDVLLVYDDVALSLGSLRLRSQGGPGGHRGMESVIQNLRTDRVARLRLGVAPEKELESEVELADFVLSVFGDDEIAQVEEMVDRAVAACASWVSEGTERTMNRFNG